MTEETEKKVRELIIEYVEEVGYQKATDECLYVLAKLGNTSRTFIDLRAGKLLPVARFRVMVLEYLYGNDDTMEREIINAAKQYIHDSKRIANQNTRKGF